MQLSFKGLKATDRLLRLGRLNLVVGPNGSAKSSIAEAIRFAALGYVPALGKRLDDTAAIMRGRQLEVELALDDLHTVRRTLTRTKDGGLRGGLECSWVSKVQGQKEPAVELLKLCGTSADEVAEMLDIRALARRRSSRCSPLAGMSRTRSPTLPR